MLDRNHLEAERNAVRSLDSLYEQAFACQKAYEQAHLVLPEALKRFLGITEEKVKRDNANGSGVSAVSAVAPSLPPPRRSDVPQGAGDDWVSIDMKDALPTTAALAILAASRVPVKRQDLQVQIAKHLPNTPEGSIANIGTRLTGTAITREADGWMLVPGTPTGLIHEGRIWGPKAAFSKYEIAAYRRDLIVYVLSHFKSGLQPVQLVEQVNAYPWFPGPMTKDTMKMDLEALVNASRIRRRGNTKKWEVAPERDEASAMEEEGELFLT